MITLVIIDEFADKEPLISNTSLFKAWKLPLNENILFAICRAYYINNNIIEIGDIWLNQKFSEARANLAKSNRNFSPCDKCDVTGTFMGKEHVQAWQEVKNEKH